jgi:hypothetical protein
MDSQRPAANGSQDWLVPSNAARQVGSRGWRHGFHSFVAFVPFVFDSYVGPGLLGGLDMAGLLL